MTTVQGPAVPVSAMLMATGGALLFSINDVSIKFLSGDYPLHQVILVRATIGLMVLAVVMAVTSAGLGALRTRRPLMHLTRSLIVLASNASYFLALAAMPLADAVALAFVAPIFITVLSVLILREKVGPHRIGAVILGLIGTIVLLRPGGEALQVSGMLVLFSAFCYALSQMITRAMRGTESAVTMNIYSQLGFFVSSIAIGLILGDGRFAGGSHPSLEFLLRAWAWPPMHDWPAFLASGMAVAFGGLLMSQAYRTMEAAAVAPFEYASLPMAIFWGAVIFGTLPDMVGVIGMMMIVSSGLYTVWREALRRGHR